MNRESFLEWVNGMPVITTSVLATSVVPDPTSAARARAEEALRLLKTLKRMPGDVCVHYSGTAVDDVDDARVAWFPAAYPGGGAAGAEANARFFAAAPRLIEQLAADVIALAERSGR